MAKNTLTEQVSLDSSLNVLSVDTLTVQISCVDLPLALCLFVLSLYVETLGGRGFTTVLFTITLQAPLDSICNELPTDISPLKILCGKIGEIWRYEIANNIENLTVLSG